MAGHPLVSVLLPVRDGAADLAGCIRSLQTQTLRDFEVVAVDDGSVDPTPDLLETWADVDDRVRVISQGREGLVRALERGRAACRGRFLARMDADDVAHRNWLERQLHFMITNPELAGCGCAVEYFPREIVRDGALRYERWINEVTEPEEIERDAFVECPLAHPTFFLRADAVAAVGGYRDCGWPEDYDLFLRLREAGARFGKVPEVLLRWREGPERLSRTADSYSPEAFRRCKSHFLVRERGQAEGAGFLVWGAGPTGKAFARTLAAAGGEVRAFVDLDPNKIGQEIHGAPVIDPDGVDRYRDAYALAAVGQEGARKEIREALRARGWEELKDFRAVA